MPSVKSYHVGDMVFETQVGDLKVLNDVPQPRNGAAKVDIRRRRTTSLHPCQRALRPSCSSTARNQRSMRPDAKSAGDWRSESPYCCRPRAVS
jgi:hypothetical protein